MPVLSTVSQMHIRFQFFRGGGGYLRGMRYIYIHVGRRGRRGEGGPRPILEILLCKLHVYTEI